MNQAADAQNAGTIWALDLGEFPLAIEPRLPASFARVGPDAANRLAAAMSLDGPAEVQRRLDTGRRCYAAEVGGELVAYGWVSFEQEAVGELDLVISLTPGDAYIWDCATVAAKRRHRLYTALLVHIASTLQTEGLHRIWIGAAPTNVVSHAGIALAGFHPVADLFLSRERATPSYSVRGRPGMPAGLLDAARRLFLGDMG
jgi:hypothetical protein